MHAIQSFNIVEIFLSLYNTEGISKGRMQQHEQREETSEQGCAYLVQPDSYLCSSPFHSALLGKCQNLARRTYAGKFLQHG